MTLQTWWTILHTVASLAQHKSPASQASLWMCCLSVMEFPRALYRPPSYLQPVPKCIECKYLIFIFHFYVDDKVLYCCAESLDKAVLNLLTGFDVVSSETCFAQTKFMVFTKNRTLRVNPPLFVTFQEKVIEIVSAYRYLGILIDDCLTFKPHILSRSWS